jgi:hypothetical protein
VGTGVDLPNEARGSHHLLVHPHLGLLPFDSLGEVVEQSGVTRQPSRGEVEPTEGVKIDSLQTTKIGVWAGIDVPEQ